MLIQLTQRACTRAAFQFLRKRKAGEDDRGVDDGVDDVGVPDYESSVFDDGECDVEMWRNALRQSVISHRMYFV